MRRMYSAAVILAVIAVPTITGSVAEAAVYYPWCAQYGGKRSGGITNCGYVSWSQCRASVIGAGGFCEPNPEYFARCRNCANPYSETTVRQSISAP
jgi:hypothetical protein